MVRPRQTPYGEAYFDAQEQWALESARVVVPVVVDLLNPGSVVDVGCGRGAWLRAFSESGVTALRGLDGPYVDPAKLLVDPGWFEAVDLRRRLTIEGTYDLALCLEVAEHLPKRCARPLVRALTGAAHAVLWSAAIPGQGGTHHVNEQWPGYWEVLFRERGYHRLDPIRPLIWRDQRVAWWYRQNLVLYASDAALARWPRLAADRAPEQGITLELVHPDILARLMAPRPRARKSLA